MPLYEYRCEAEGHRFEKIQSFSAPEQTECPKCGSVSLRLLSAPAIQFKGSGFYLTDYGKKGGGSKGEGGSESKPSTDGGKGSAPAAAPSSAPASIPGSGSSGSGSGGSGSAS